VVTSAIADWSLSTTTSLSSGSVGMVSPEHRGGNGRKGRGGRKGREEGEGGKGGRGGRKEREGAIRAPLHITHDVPGVHRLFYHGL